MYAMSEFSINIPSEVSTYPPLGYYPVAHSVLFDMEMGYILLIMFNTRPPPPKFVQDVDNNQVIPQLEDVQRTCLRFVLRFFHVLDHSSVYSSLLLLSTRSLFSL